MKNMYFYQTPVGKISIADDGTSITNLYFNDGALIKDYEQKETKLIKEAFKQLNDYFLGLRKHFDIPLSTCGTDFQKRVWEALLMIPFGQTRSYGEIAKSIGNTKAARAVGMANNRNPIPIFIPCHRVIGADGSLVGYAGGLKIKEYLLSLENVNKV